MLWFFSIIPHVNTDTVKFCVCVSFSNACDVKNTMSALRIKKKKAMNNRYRIEGFGFYHAIFLCRQEPRILRFLSLIKSVLAINDRVKPDPVLNQSQT